MGVMELRSVKTIVSYFCTGRSANTPIFCIWLDPVRVVPQDCIHGSERLAFLPIPAKCLICKSLLVS